MKENQNVNKLDKSMEMSNFFGVKVLTPMEQGVIKGGVVPEHYDKDLDNGNTHIHQHIHIA